MDNYENPELNPQHAEEETPETPAVTETEEVTETSVVEESYEAMDSNPIPETYAPRSPFADSPYEMPDEPVAKPAPVDQTPKKQSNGIGKKILCGLICAAVILASIAVGCIITAHYLNGYWSGVMQLNEDHWEERFQEQIKDLEEKIKDNSYTGNGNSISGTPNISADGLTPGQVYAQNVKSVVAISNQVTTTNIYGQVSKTASSGSGFIISEDGYIVSNYHVVEGATSLTVITWDGTEHAAKYIGGDEANDLAVLKIEASDLQAAKLGSSNDLIVGDMVAAIGNPLGELTSTLTVGYVSAKDRDINASGAMINMIQTDAAINPGNSGGPLFNMKGEVVGITTAKYAGTTIEGIGFAIPMDYVINKIKDLQEFGFISGAYLGVYVQDVSPSLAYYGIPTGAYIKEVIPDFCAHAAGIQAKDIILSIGSHKIGGINDLSRVMQTFKAGESTTITVWRSGQNLSLEITLDAKPTGTNS